MNGVIVLDKPAGLTANRVLSRLKHLLGRPKMGYLGTLDPLATGVLPVFVGKATKLIAEFEGLDKSYRVAVRLGQRTDTYDAEGTVLEERPLGGLSAARAVAALEGLLGERDQTAPSYSALKYGGVPAYRLARQGHAVPARVRRVRLWDLRLERAELPELRFAITVSAGTYIRSLAEELGRTLGVGAHVTGLRRTACGCLFTLENSVRLEDVAKDVDGGRTGFLLNPARFLLHHHPLRILPADEPPVRQGRVVTLSGIGAGWQPRDKIKALRPDGTLVAVGEVVRAGNGQLGFQPGRVLIEPVRAPGTQTGRAGDGAPRPIERE